MVGKDRSDQRRSLGSIRDRGVGRDGVPRWQIVADAGRDPETGHRRQVYRTVVGERAEAERALARLVIEVDDGRHAATDLNLAQLCDRWLDHHGPNLSPTTLRRHQVSVRTHIRGTKLGSIPIRKLRTADLDRFYATLRTRGIAPSTIRQVHAVVRQSLRQAVRWDLLHTNVAKEATLPRARARDIRPPSPGEVARLLDAAAADPAFATYLRAAVTTGARRGELCGLQWGDIDFDAACLVVRRNVVHGQLHGDIVVKDTKTHSMRRMSLDVGTADALRRHRTRCLEDALAFGFQLGDSTFVFATDPSGTEPWHPDAVTNRFAHVRARAGLSGVRLHDLRHFAATRLVAAGVPIPTVSGRLGHRDTATTLNVYSHWLPEQDRAAAEVLGDLLDGTP